MNMTIWKYKLQPVCDIVMPVDAEILTVAEQNGGVCSWAKVNPNAVAVQRRRFVSYATGETFCEDRNMRFIGTVTMPPAGFVFHVFEQV